MKIWAGLTFLCFLLAGCALPQRRDPVQEGRHTFASMQAAAVAAAESAKGSIARVTLLGFQQEQNHGIIRIGNAPGRSGVGERILHGIVLTTNGYVIVADELDPDRFDRIEVYVGDREYRARLIETDNQLGMSLIKMDSQESFLPLDFTSTADLSPGEWCVGVQPTGEEFDYESMVSLAVCLGALDGRYRTFLVDTVGLIQPGTLLLDMEGRPAAIMRLNGRAWSISDLREDLEILLADAQGESVVDRDARGNVWFGVMMQPINREYARMHDLDRSSIWLQHVIQGGSADLAGLRAGDLLIGVNGHDIRFSGSRAQDYFMKMLRPREGAPFQVTVLRDGERVKLSGTFVTREPDVRVRADDVGVTVRQIRPGSSVLGNFFTEEGVFVEEVHSGSPAAVGRSVRSSLLSRGDIITAVAGTPTPDVESFSRVLETLRRERHTAVRIDYMRGRVTGIAALNLQIGDMTEDRSER